MNKKIFWSLLSFLTLILLKANLVLAQSNDVTGVNDLTNAGVNLAQSDLKQVIANIINIFLGFLGVLAVVLILYAGYLWMTSRGDEEKIKTAKGIIVSAVIGLVIILSAYAIASFVLNKLYEATNPNSNNNNGGTIINPIVVPPDCPAPDDGSVRICKVKPNANSATIGQYITIEGWNFETYNAVNSKVKFDGSGVIQEASLINCNGQAAWNRLNNRPNNYFRIKAIVPNVALGNYRIKINTASNKEGSYPDLATFEVREGEPGPGIACVTPNTQRRGEGIMIEGIGFGDSGFVDIFNWDGNVWQSNRFGSIGTWTDTKITNAIVPMNALSGDLFVEVNEIQSAPEDFNVLCDNGPNDCASGCCAANACVDENFCLSAATESDGPVITRISPEISKEGSIVSVYGSGFGSSGGRVVFEGADGNEKFGIDPHDVNSACTDYWSDNLIVIVVPAEVRDTSANIFVRHVDERESNSKIFNDSGEEAPSLCKLEPTSGSFGEAVVAHGFNFNNTDSAFFGGVNGTFSYDNPQKANLVVPNLSAGELSVWFKNTADKSSNELPFSVEVAGGGAPIINSINPDNAPAGQYLTIIGSNFGNIAGSVRFIKPDGTFDLGDFDFPAQCLANYWRNDSIVVKAPNLASGPYQIKVIRSSDSEQSNAYNFNMSIGAPGPGLCFMDPNNGPANGVFDVTLYGDNFGNVSDHVYFSSGVSSEINSWSDQLINVRVPNGAVTGPTKVRVGAQDSNGLNFSVATCTNNTQCVSGNECCQEATGNYCAPLGHCPADLSCSYSWTITTAADPFSLQELACDPAVHNLSSPSPWPGATDAYLDTNITGMFNADVEDADFNTTSNLKLFACNTGGAFNSADCVENIAVNLTIINHNSNQEGFVLNPGINLTPNRWYKVALGEFNKASGSETWSGATYDWHFRAQENLCQVVSIAVTPTDSPSADIYVGHEREFSASPIGGNCNICGSNYNWSAWSLEGSNADKANIGWFRTQNTNIAKVKVEGTQVTENSTPATVTVKAQLNGLMSYAYPKIKDAVLEVVDYGPNCNSSCTNALVWVDFNTAISESNLYDNIVIKKCTDSTCALLTGANLVTSFDVSVDGRRVAILHSDFIPETYYKVELKQELKNIAGYKISAPFSWSFQTNKDGACTPTSLEIDPSYYLATDDSMINYSAFPYSTANACDPHGQILNPMSYSPYNWSLNPAGIADLIPSNIYRADIRPQAEGMTRVNASLSSYTLEDQAILEVDFGDTLVYTAPKIVPTPKPQTPACLNSAIEVQFNTLMDRASLEAGMRLYKKSASEELPGYCVKKDFQWYCPVETNFVFTNNSDKSKAFLYPVSPLQASTEYLSLVSGRVKSNMGVNLVTEQLNFDSDDNGSMDAYIWLFETNNQMCRVSFVTVAPNPDLFSCSRSNCLGDVADALSGNQHSYTAIAYDPSGSPLVMTDYAWQENNDFLDLESDNQQTILATALNKNGQTNLIVEVSDELAGSALGSAQVDLFLCEHPWPRQASNFPYDFNDLYNFSTYYCQDSGRVNEPLLPYLGSPNILPPNGQTLREFIFIVDPKQTVIAKSEENTKNYWWQNLFAKVKNTVLAAIAIPSAPTSLLLADNSADGVKLAWTDNATNEDGFNIYRKSSTVDWYKIATVDSGNQNPINFTDNNVINNEVYSYRVTAYNMGGESAATNEIAVTAKASSLDVIGVRVMKNEEHLALSDWYTKYAPNPEIAGQAQVIDGYPALKVGNTIYINALNVVDVNGGSVYSNIYMISYSIGARESTADIVSQMLSNLHLSTNVSNMGVCSSDASISCSSKFDCPNQGNCDADGDKLRRDNQRLGDLLSIQNKLKAYSNNYKFCNNNANISCTQDSQCPSGGDCVPYYPLLNAGTYVPHIAVSPWPSWQQEFSNVLGMSLPVDPLNRFSACPDGFDEETCWNDEINRFTCPLNSSIYFYKNEGGYNYSLDANFEFVYPNNYTIPDLDEHIHLNNPQCNASFNGLPQGSLGCGNGVVDGAEECDGGFQNLCDTTPEPDNNQDWWNEHLGGCYPAGSLDADGNSIECTWYEPWPILTEAMCGGYCGDHILDDPYETCEGNNTVVEEYSCLDGQTATCNTCTPVCSDGSVASPASCGDGVINPSEECDTTNLAGKDCTAFDYDYGNLSCNQCNFDLSDCSDEESLPPPPPNCGNGVINPPEQCDGSNLNNQTCQDFGWDQGSLSCNASCNFNQSNCSEIAESDGATIFLTSTAYNGNLLGAATNKGYSGSDGLAAADYLCQWHADSQNSLAREGIWKAWLSDFDTSAGSRLAHNSLEYKMTNGTVIADDWTDLTDTTLDNAINRLENGEQTAMNNPINDCTAQGCIFWSGTKYDGSIYYPGIAMSGEICNMDSEENFCHDYTNSFENIRYINDCVNRGRLGETSKISPNPNSNPDITWSGGSFLSMNENTWPRCDHTLPLLCLWQQPMNNNNNQN